MPKTFEIYFHNLNEKAQKEYLEFRGMEEYTETAPIATVEQPDPFYWGP